MLYKVHFIWSSYATICYTVNVTIRYTINTTIHYAINVTIRDSIKVTICYTVNITKCSAVNVTIHYRKRARKVTRTYVSDFVRGASIYAQFLKNCVGHLENRLNLSPDWKFQVCWQRICPQGNTSIY